MERIDFIKQCGKVCLGGIIAPSLLESCASNYYAVTKTNGTQITINKSEFFKIKDGESKARKYILARHEKLNFPICIFKLTENTYSAILMECTHNSCELNPTNSNFVICPCHGSEFDQHGKVQNPPAELDLITYKITHDNENIYIQL